MPPKVKSKETIPGKKRKAKKAKPPSKQRSQMSETSLQGKELDLVKDLNEDFFAEANKTMQKLMEGSRFYEASKIKKYVDIIYNLHRKYDDEVKELDVLRPQINRAKTKLRLALELTANSEEAMERLREALEQAWYEIDALVQRKQETQYLLDELTLKCEGFNKTAAHKAGGDENLGQLSGYKKLVLRERDRLNGEVLDLEKRLQFQRYYSESVEGANKTLEDELAKVKFRVRELEKERDAFELKIRELKNRWGDEKDQNKRILNSLECVSSALMSTQSQLALKTKDFDSLKLTMGKLHSDNLANNRELAKNKVEVTKLRQAQTENEETIRALRLEEKANCNTIKQLTQKFNNAVQDRSSISFKLYKVNQTNQSLNEDLARFKNQTNALARDLNGIMNKFDELRRLNENMHHERETLRNNVAKSNDTIAYQKHTIARHSKQVDSLNLDIKKLNEKLDESQLNISRAESERDEMAQQVKTVQQMLAYYQEQTELKTKQVNDLNQKLQQQKLQLVDIKKQLEAAHSAKMTLTRNLDTCSQERNNFRVLQKKTTHQIAQLTSGITAHQSKINSLNFQIERLSKDKKDLQSQLKNKETILANVRKDLGAMKARNGSLLKTISDDELKFKKVAQDLENSRKGKGLIGSQMVRRNDEIVSLKNKMSIMQKALDEGKLQYNQRVQDINLLKIELKNVRKERACMTRANKSTADMREEVIRLERLLNQERMRVRMLNEDAKTPTAVHHWRIVGGMEPDRLQLQGKVQTLQRSNWKLETEKKKLAQKLDQQNRATSELKQKLGNVPKTDVKQKLVETQRKNRVLEKKTKLLNAEAYMYKVELEAKEAKFNRKNQSYR